MLDVQADINESQSVQAALTAAGEAQAAVAAVATQTPGPVVEQPEIPTLTDKVEPEGELRTTKSPSVMDEAKAEIAAKSNTGAALAEQRAAFKVGGAQAGNAMDTMHGSVNKTWPPTVKS